MWPTVLLSMLCAILGFGAAEAWEHRPTHTPAIHVLFVNWSPADGLAAQRDAARAGLTQCHANNAVLTDAVNAQNSAVAAWGAERDRTASALGMASQDALRARAVAESLRQSIASRKAPVGYACTAGKSLVEEFVK